MSKLMARSDERDEIPLGPAIAHARENNRFSAAPPRVQHHKIRHLCGVCVVRNIVKPLAERAPAHKLRT